MTESASVDPQAAATPERPPKSVLRDYAETILICVIFVVFSRAFVFQQSKIPSRSMEDTLLVGDYIMVNRFVFSHSSWDWERKLLPMRDIQRGDVIVFKQPDTPEIDYIKRVIGLPGDVVSVDHGRVLVNGERVDEPYVKPEFRIGDRPFMAPVRVLPGHYWVMGDHRNDSSDSRVWGQVPAELVKGRALLVWWSFDEPASDGTMTLGERLRSWGTKLAFFFTRSRWDRCFQLIR